MEQIGNLIKSPAFWVSSVIIAFLMSFFACYAKDWTDKYFIKRTAKKDEEARLRRSNFDEKVIKLSENPILLSLYQTNIIYQKLRQVLYLLVMYVFLAFSVYSALRDEFVPAIGMLIMLGVIGVQMWSVSRRLVDLRAVVNAVLGDSDEHFVG